MTDEPNCWTCAYRDLPETAEPCASCDMYFSHFESTEPTEPTDTAASEDARREAKMAGPTCLTCKHKGVSIEEEPCISCNGYQNYTPDESARRKREEELLKRTCDTCKYKNLDRSVEPCHSCNWYSGFNPDEEDVLSPCSTCKYGDLPGTTEPCASCFDEGLDHPLNYEEATESGDEGIMPQHIVDMFAERVKQAALRSVNERNAHPRPCPYCGEIPEVVEETIYPGEKHCYVVCNGAKHLPHSISVHGRTREEAVAHWNSFAIDIISQRK